MKNIKTYIIIGLVIIIVILSQCRNNTKTVTKTKHFRDTITQIDTIIKTITKVHKDLPVYIHDTVLLNTPIDTNKIYNTYTSNIKDSLLNGLITVKAQNRPFIDFKYTLKQYEINNTTLIKDSVYNEVKKGYVSGGLMLEGCKESFGFAPFLQYNNKGNGYKIGYDLINKRYMVGFSKKISFKRK